MSKRPHDSGLLGLPSTSSEKNGTLKMKTANKTGFLCGVWRASNHIGCLQGQNVGGALVGTGMPVVVLNRCPTAAFQGAGAHGQHSRWRPPGCIGRRRTADPICLRPLRIRPRNTAQTSRLRAVERHRSMHGCCRCRRLAGSPLVCGVRDTRTIRKSNMWQRKRSPYHAETLRP